METDPGKRAGRRWPRWAGVALAGGLCAWGLLAVQGGLEGRRMVEGGPAPATDLEVFRRENRILRQELALASLGDPYLVLDLGVGRLLLKSHGVPLRVFPVRDPWVRTGRLHGVRGGLLMALDTAWGSGILHPPVRRERKEILADTTAPPDLSGTVSYIPPTPEEWMPAPATFRLRYPGGLGLLVRRGDTLGAGGLRHWLAMAPWRRDRLRLEVTLAPDDAGALYRTYQDGTPLLVLAPEPGGVERK